MKHLLCALLLMIAVDLSASAVNDCPRGKVDCRGACGMMVDANGDGFCDRGGLSRTADYWVLEIALGLLALYLVSTILSAKKVYSKSVHRKIWNYALLITFLVSGLLGLWLAVVVRYGVSVTDYHAWLVWHVNVGIAMALVGVIHCVWHLRYYFPCKK